MLSSAQLTLSINPGTARIVFWDDGSASVTLDAVMAARRDVTGEIHISPEGRITCNKVEDSFGYRALTPYVIAVVEKRAHEYLARATRQLHRIAAAHTTSKETT